MTDPALLAAAAQSRAALAAGQGDAYDLAIVALAHSAAGEFDQADVLFDRALAMEPGNPSTLTSLAIHRRRQGRVRDAVLACDAAIRAYPGYPDAWLERASILASGGSLAAARDSYRQAARIAPDHAAAHAGLAALSAREGDHGAARQHAEAALARDAANPMAITALARAELADGELHGAERRLHALLAGLAIASLDRSMGHSALGDVYDRLGEPDQAHHHYAAAKADFAALHADQAAPGFDQYRFVDGLAAGLRATSAADWPPVAATQPPLAPPRHIFLMGYPRSGTTLVENILASLPGVFALEERPTLARVDADHILGPPETVAAGVARFAALAPDQLDTYRRAYWHGVAESGMPAGTAAFVDMDPLKGTRLPFIARLFPDARILVMRRDPRDVVWSCFRTNFAMGSGTLEYTTLDRAARHYAALMGLMDHAFAILPVQVHAVAYHRLVRDFDAETRAMCAFAGLEWNESVRRFDRTAAQRGTSTASVGQVRRGLYDGTGQWRPYARYLEPVLPILQPWIDRFGDPD